MHAVPYSLSTLVPKGLYATQVKALLAATRRLIEAMPDEEFRRDNLDLSLRELPAGSETSAADLFRVLRVALTWPNARPDLFEVMLAIGRVGTLDRLDMALIRLTDEAQG